MEELTPISVKTGGTREYYTYKVDWPLELDSDGKNFITTYFGLKSCSLNSGEKYCKTGPFAGKGKYFEFTLSPSPRHNGEIEVTLKWCYPTIPNECYKVLSASASAVGKQSSTVSNLGNFYVVPAQQQQLAPLDEPPKPAELGESVNYLRLTVQQHLGGVSTPRGPMAATLCGPMTATPRGQMWLRDQMLDMLSPGAPWHGPAPTAPAQFMDKDYIQRFTFEIKMCREAFQY